MVEHGLLVTVPVVIDCPVDRVGGELLL